MKGILSAINGTEFDEINVITARIIYNMLRLIESTSEDMLRQGVIVENVMYNEDGQVSETKKIINPACKFLTDAIRELKLNMSSSNIDRRSQLKLFEKQEENVTIAQIMSDLRGGLGEGLNESDDNVNKINGKNGANGETLWQ